MLVRRILREHAIEILDPGSGDLVAPKQSRGAREETAQHLPSAGRHASPSSGCWLRQPRGQIASRTEVFGALVYPSDVRPATPFSLSAESDHLLRRIHRVHSLDMRRERPGQLACSAPQVQHDAWFVFHEVVEGLEDLVGVRRIIHVRVRDALISELLGILRCQVPGSWSAQRVSTFSSSQTMTMESPSTAASRRPGRWSAKPRAAMASPVHTGSRQSVTLSPASRNADR